MLNKAPAEPEPNLEKEEAAMYSFLASSQAVLASSHANLAAANAVRATELAAMKMEDEFSALRRRFLKREDVTKAGVENATECMQVTADLMIEMMAGLNKNENLGPKSVNPEDLAKLAANARQVQMLLCGLEPWISRGEEVPLKGDGGANSGEEKKGGDK